MAQPDQVQLINYVTNHPDVRPWVAPHHSYVDVSGLLDMPGNPGTVMFGDHRGLIVFLPTAEPGMMEMHWMLTEAIRGPAALGMAQNAIATMFTKTNCYAITGATPRENRVARTMNRALGGLPIGEVDDTQGRRCIIYLLERKTWAISSAA